MASPCCNVLIRAVKKKEPNCCSRKNPLINGLLKVGDRLLFDSDKHNVEKNKSHWEKTMMQWEWERTCSFRK